MKSFLIPSFIFLCTSFAIGQVGIGTIAPNGALEIASTTDGLIIPRVALTDLTTLTVTTPTESELVFNTTSNGTVEPGYYYLADISGTLTWVRFGGSGWLLDGNLGVTAANFMGSLNDADVAFRRFNAPAGKIATFSTSFGLGAASINTATATTAFGVNALALNTAAQGNTAVGSSALASNNGNGVSFAGSNNTAVGTSALTSNTSGRFNTAVGTAALSSNTNAEYNVGIGSNALRDNTTGDNNIGIGINALLINTIGYDNVAIGLQALDANTSGRENVAIGSQALTSNVTGIQNVGIGFNALTGNLGSANIGIGWNASPAVGTYFNNVAIGFQSLERNTQSSNNTAIGFQTLTFLNNNIAQKNVAVGFWSMQNSSGSVEGNSFLGAESGRNSTGIFSTGVGFQALGSLAGPANSGIQNTAVGQQALAFNGSGQQNSALGAESLYRVTSGSFNTGVGYRAGGAVTNGTNNTYIGYQSGSNATTGTNNSTLGFNAQLPAGNTSNYIQLGNTAIATIHGQVAYTFGSDRRLKSNIKNSPLGLDFIKTLRPVSYYRKADKDNKTEYGFIAQEIEEALYNVGDTNNGVITTHAEGMLGLRITDIIPMNVKAIQEQQELIEKLQKDNEELKVVNAAILKRLEALENRK